MATQYGRTVADWTSLLISSGAAMVALPVDTIGEIGLDYPEEDMSAFIDVVKGYLVGKPDFSLDFGGPLNNVATTGVIAIMNAKAGVMTASSFDIQIGIRHAWEAGEPQFGITGGIAANNGIMIVNFKVLGAKYSARMRMIAPCTVAPAWGTAAEAVPS